MNCQTGSNEIAMEQNENGIAEQADAADTLNDAMMMAGLFSPHGDDDVMAAVEQERCSVNSVDSVFWEDESQFRPSYSPIPSNSPRDQIPSTSTENFPGPSYAPDVAQPILPTVAPSTHRVQALGFGPKRPNSSSVKSPPKRGRPMDNEKRQMLRKCKYYCTNYTLSEHSDVKSRSCLACDKITTRSFPGNLKMHVVHEKCNILKTLYKKNDKIFSCLFCSKVFVCVFNCINHLFKFHGNEKISCTLCSDLVSFCDLKSHKNWHFDRCLKMLMNCKCGFVGSPNAMVEHFFIDPHNKNKKNLSKAIFERNCIEGNCKLAIMCLMFAKEGLRN